MTREAELITEEPSEAQQLKEPALLVEVTRGAITESRHRGHLVVLDGEGELLYGLGDTGVVTFLRSSAKPHQTIPLVARGAAEHFRFREEEIAVACGSHNGEAEHIGAVSSMLKKIGLDESALRCGAHEPYGEKAAQELKRRGEEPTPIYNNCSGKHAAMLALALYLGAPVENYESPEHPVQQLIARTVAQFSGLRVEDLGLAVDGCAAPNFAMPLRSMALMYSRLVHVPSWLDDATRQASAHIIKSMQSHPRMVEGEGELDTLLMEVCEGKLISKVGAEGVYTAGVLPCERYPKGLGLAFKIEDGDKNDRARSPVAVELLRQLGVLEELGELKKFSDCVIRNHRGDEVGKVVTSFRL